MMSKTLHALATCSMLAVVTLTVPIGTAWAEEQPITSTQAKADSQIISLLDQIESALVKSSDVPVDETIHLLLSAQKLLPSASVQVRDLMQDFPARLRKHADEQHDNVVRAITLTAFANTISDFFDKHTETARLESAPAQSPVLSSTEHTLLKRGDAMLRLGDVSAARMLFVRAAELGIGIAALKVADTYDPAFLAEHNLRGIKADPVEAERWYRKAQSMGEPQAEEHLKRLERRRVLATH
jgi:hypothetical protein